MVPTTSRNPLHRRGRGTAARMVSRQSLACPTLKQRSHRPVAGLPFALCSLAQAPPFFPHTARAYCRCAHSAVGGKHSPAGHLSAFAQFGFHMLQSFAASKPAHARARLRPPFCKWPFWPRCLSSSCIVEILRGSDAASKGALLGVYRGSKRSQRSKSITEPCSSSISSHRPRMLGQRVEEAIESGSIDRRDRPTTKNWFAEASLEAHQPAAASAIRG